MSRNPPSATSAASGPPSSAPPSSSVKTTNPRSFRRGRLLRRALSLNRRIFPNIAAIPKIRLLRIQIVRRLQPLFHFPINLSRSFQFNAMRNAVFLLHSSGVDDALGQFSFVFRERESEVDARIRRWLDLRKYMLPVQRHYRLARTRLHIAAQRLSKLQ